MAETTPPLVLETRQKLLRGDQFLRALQESGLLPSDARVTGVQITAAVGMPITMVWSEYAREPLADVIPGLVETDDPTEAICR